MGCPLCSKHAFTGLSATEVKPAELQVMWQATLSTLNVASTHSLAYTTTACFQNVFPATVQVFLLQ